MDTKARFPVYDRAEGNVFLWILRASEGFRKIRQKERYDELEKAAEKSKSVDSTRVGN